MKITRIKFFDRLWQDIHPLLLVLVCKSNKADARQLPVYYCCHMFSFFGSLYSQHLVFCCVVHSIKNSRITLASYTSSGLQGLQKMLRLSLTLLFGNQDYKTFHIYSLKLLKLEVCVVFQQKKREMVASAFGEDETGSRQTRLTVDDLKYLFQS